MVRQPVVGDNRRIDEFLQQILSADLGQQAAKLVLVGDLVNAAGADALIGFEDHRIAQIFGQFERAVCAANAFASSNRQTVGAKKILHDGLLFHPIHIFGRDAGDAVGTVYERLRAQPLLVVGLHQIEAGGRT